MAGYQLPVVMDPSSLVGGQYGLRAVPTLVIYLVLQKQFVAGLTLGSSKG